MEILLSVETCFEIQRNPSVSFFFLLYFQLSHFMLVIRFVWTIMLSVLLSGTDRRLWWSPETWALDIWSLLVIFQHVFQHGKDLTKDISSPPPPSSDLHCFVSVSSDHCQSGGLTHFSVSEPGMRADWILLWHSAMMLQCCCNNSKKITEGRA